MKTKTKSRRTGAAASRRAAAPRKAKSKASAASKLQRDVEARSRGDSPRANTARERSPKTENL